MLYGVDIFFGNVTNIYDYYITNLPGKCVLILGYLSGVVFASQESLPNSIFYPLKVNIVEPIRGALTFSHKNKAKYEINLATERLVEAETLAGQGKLDKINEKKLNNLLNKHTVACESLGSTSQKRRFEDGISFKEST